MGHAEEVNLIRSYLMSFKTGDPILVASHVSDDFKNEHLGVLGKGCVSKAVYEERLGGFLARFENLEYEPLDIVADDGRGSARYEMRFKHQGEDVTVPGMMWFELANGKITKRVDCWDSLKYLKQVVVEDSEVLDLLK